MENFVPSGHARVVAIVGHPIGQVRSPNMHVWLVRHLVAPLPTPVPRNGHGLISFACRFGDHCLNLAMTRTAAVRSRAE